MQVRWLTLGVMVAGLCGSGCGNADGDANGASGGSAGIGNGGASAGGAAGVGGAGAGGAPATGGALGSGGVATGGSSGASGMGGTATGGAGAGGTAGGGSGGTAGGGAGGMAGAAGNGGAGGAQSNGFAIKFDYRFDTMNTFTPERRAALEAAGKVWESLIADDFEDVPENTLIRCRDPKTPDGTGMVFTVDYPIDDLAIFVAFTTIDGAANRLAVSSNSFTNQVTDGALLAKLNARYHENPFQPWVGQTSYDQTEAWYFDATPETDDDIPDAADDFITTALHEIGHLLGVGASAAFDALVVDGKFTGAHAVAVNGGPVLLSTDMAHIDKSVMSEGRRNLMDPSSPVGTRKRPTTLDLAILQDLGYHLKK